MPYKDPEKKRQALRDWRAKNPEKQQAIIDRSATTSRVYRAAHKFRYAELQREWRTAHPRENLIILARARAKERGLPCTITVEELDWPTHCPIFSMELDYTTTPVGQRQHAKRDAFPTLDRKIPELGYVPGNVFVLSFKANRLKQDSTIDQLEALLAYMKS